MNKRLCALLAMILCAAMCAAVFAGCGKVSGNDDPTGSEKPTEAPVVIDSERATEEPTEAPAPKTFAELYPGVVPAARREAERIAGTAYENPLSIGCAGFAGQFSPFFAVTTCDRAVSDMTQIRVGRVDRDGVMVMNGIEGETREHNGTEYFYNGAADLSIDRDEANDTTKYTVVLRPDMAFSDGEPVTIDDLIFTYYVLLDLGYNGVDPLRSCNIVGLRDYRTQTTPAVYKQLEALTNDMLEAGFDYTCTGGESFTQEQHDTYWAKVREGWEHFCSGIVDYIVQNYASNGYVQMLIDPDYTADTFLSTEGGRVAFGMAGWGFGECARNEAGSTIFTVPQTGKTFDLTAEEYPTVADYTDAMMALYGNDPVSAYNAELYFGCTCPSPEDYAVEPFIAEAGAKLMNGAAVGSIEGIKRVNDWCCEITVEGYSPNDMYYLFDTPIAPMHYYGDAALYDYDNGSYGFTRGDLSSVKEKTGEPMGAGPYRFKGFEDGTVSFEANEDYCFAKPMTKYVSFKTVKAQNMLSSVVSGAVDAASDISGTVEVFGEIMNANQNGELNGEKLHTYYVDMNSYGYIGINSDTVKVGGDPSSEASKNLRRGFAVALCCFRDTAVDSYFGAAASKIEYPISSVSWAAPRPGDEGYEKAFSRDINGEEIYTDEMTDDERAEAALAAAKGYFEAAGFTFGEDGKVNGVPEGAKTNYRALIYGKGIGAHPGCLAFNEANKLLERLGFGITIIDTASPNVLWDALYSGTQEIWAAARDCEIDPDMYNGYHSSNIPGRGGSDCNYGHIGVEELDKLIEKARASADQQERKALYRQCLDLVLDQACEIPCYQRRSVTVVNPARVAVESVTPDVTANWPWNSELWMIQMAPEME